MTTKNHLGQATAPAVDGMVFQFVSATPVAVAMFDREMRYLVWSEEWSRFFGVEGIELKGRCHYDVFPDLPERWRQAHSRGLSGEPVDCEEDTMQLEGGRQVWLSWRVRPIRNADGAVVAIALFTKDITEETLAKIELRKSTARLQQITMALGIGLFEHDFTSRQSIVSDGYLDLLGISRDETPKTTDEWVSLLRPVDVDAYHAASRRAMDPAGDGSFTCEVRPLVRGVERVMEVKSRVLFRGEGTDRVPDRVVGVIVDQTESRRLQDDLSHALRLETVGRLAGLVSHDFNNILTVILANLELASLRNLDADLIPLLRNAQDAAEMGAGFNKRLLALAGGRRAEARPIRLDEHIGKVWEVFQRVLSDNVALHFRPDAAGTTVQADPAEIDAAVLNLVINARDAQPGGGLIELHTEVVDMDAAQAAKIKGGKAGRFLRLSVCDKGKGIPPEVLARLGEPFFTTKGPGRGSGLGLTSVFLSTQRAGGFVQVASTPGEGTEVSIYLPAIEDRTQTADLRSEDFPFGNGELILVVEDDPMVREAAILRLEAIGYAVIEAGNADAALKQIESGEPVDLVFSDVIMPGARSGYDLVRHLRAAHPEIAALLTSGHVSSALREREELVPPVPFLAKPYPLKTLAIAVAEALRGVRTQS
jgi:PAS domain S-box-containing protein